MVTVKLLGCVRHTKLILTSKVGLYTTSIYKSKYVGTNTIL